MPASASPTATRWRAWCAPTAPSRNCARPARSRPPRSARARGPGEYAWVRTPAADGGRTRPGRPRCPRPGLQARRRRPAGLRRRHAGHPRLSARIGDGWGRLCRLLTLGNIRAAKGDCILRLDDLLDDTARPSPGGDAGATAGGAGPRFCRVSPMRRRERPGSAPRCTRRGDDRRRLARAAHRWRRRTLPLLAINDVLYASPERARPAGCAHLHPRRRHHRARPGVCSRPMPSAI